MTKRGYRWLWVVWGVLFAAIEGPALVNSVKGDTLSETLRAWFATRSKPVGWQLRRAALALFLFWLIVHLFGDGDESE